MDLLDAEQLLGEILLRDLVAIGNPLIFFKMSVGPGSPEGEYQVTRLLNEQVRLAYGGIDRFEDPIRFFIVEAAMVIQASPNLPVPNQVLFLIELLIDAISETMLNSFRLKDDAVWVFKHVEA